MQILCQRVEKGRERQSVGQQDPGSFTSVCLSLCSPRSQACSWQFCILSPIGEYRHVQGCDSAWDGLAYGGKGYGVSLHRQTADGFMFPPQLFEQSEWQPTNVDGKGYLLNEPGAQPSSVYGDFSCKEEPEIDSPGGKRSPGLYMGSGEAYGDWGMLGGRAR